MPEKLDVNCNLPDWLKHAGGKISFSISEAAIVTSLSRSFIYNALSNQELQGRKAGSRTIILRTDLEKWLQTLPLFGGSNRL
jgi:excisionase family DNA binding protein